MSEFTKGQWKLDTQDGYIRANGHPIAQVFGATVHNNEATADECFANAQLILNAPEMYEAIDNLLNKDSTIDTAEALLDAFLELKILLARIDGMKVANA